MTNMPERKDAAGGNYTHFAIVSTTVCIPFLVLIGSLNTHRGMNWWRTKTYLVWTIASDTSLWIARGGPFARKRHSDNSASDFPRTKSFESGMSMGGSGNTIKPLEPTLTMSGEMMRTWQRRLSSNTQRRDSCGFDKVVEPIARGDQPGMLESGNGGGGTMLRPPTVAAAAPATPTSPPPSALASMWQNERRQRLRYSEDV